MRTLACLAILAILAGCGAPATPEATETPTPGTVVTEEGDVVQADRGALRGRVHDEVNYSLAGARVSVLGSDAFTTSDAEGRFTLLDLTAGQRELQVLAVDFHPGRLSVTIEAGKTQYVDVLLLPLQPRSGGYQPHVHDFWRGSDNYTLMDAPFDPAQPGASDIETWPVMAQVVGPTTNNTLYRVPLPASEDGHPSIVLPGTKEIQVTLQWDAQTQTLPDLGFSYDTPEVKIYTPGFRAVHLPARPPGEVFTIPVDPKWVDSGHALWSDWRFFVHMDNNAATEGTDYRPGVMVGPIHVKMVLIRGDVVLDPPHRDWWEANTTITLHNEARTGVVLLGAARQMALPPETIIPPGTARMRFELTWDPNLVPTVPELSVAVRTADQDPQMTRLQDMRHFDAEVHEPGRFVAEFDVEREWPDPFYAASTNWKWYLYFDNPQPNRFIWPDSMYLALDVTLWKADP